MKRRAAPHGRLVRLHGVTLEHLGPCIAVLDADVDDDLLTEIQRRIGYPGLLLSAVETVEVVSLMSAEESLGEAHDESLVYMEAGRLLAATADGFHEHGELPQAQFLRDVARHLVMTGLDGSETTTVAVHAHPLPYLRSAVRACVFARAQAEGTSMGEVIEYLRDLVLTQAWVSQA